MESMKGERIESGRKLKLSEKMRRKREE